MHKRISNQRKFYTLYTKPHTVIFVVLKQYVDAVYAVNTTKIHFHQTVVLIALPPITFVLIHVTTFLSAALLAS